MINNSIINIGVNDHLVDLFEGQYKVPNGMSYNSYLINDEKIAILDTVDIKFADEWLENIKKALVNRNPDYLVIHHMEPDHSGSLLNFLKHYPNTCIVASGKAFSMIKQFFYEDFINNYLIVKEKDSLCLGNHCLNFISAPMVHWPEVIMSYESTEKILFSADAFGKFGALDVNEEWDDEARRYYIGIVGKYGLQATQVLNKASQLDIKAIYPLHGPILENNLPHYINLYKTWCSYEIEKNGVVIAYNSVYGNTKKAVDILISFLERDRVSYVCYDLARCDISKAVSDAFCYDKLVLATITYNGEVFPFMRNFLNELTERNFANRKIAIIENGSWAINAGRVIKKMLANQKNIEYINDTISINSSVSKENITQIEELAELLR